MFVSSQVYGEYSHRPLGAFLPHNAHLYQVLKHIWGANLHVDEDEH